MSSEQTFLTQTLGWSPRAHTMTGSRRLEVSLRSFSDQPETLGLRHTLESEHHIPGTDAKDPANGASCGGPQQEPDGGRQWREPDIVQDCLHDQCRRHCSLPEDTNPTHDLDGLVSSEPPPYGGIPERRV